MKTGTLDRWPGTSHDSSLELLLLVLCNGSRYNTSSPMTCWRKVAHATVGNVGNSCEEALRRKTRRCRCRGDCCRWPAVRNCWIRPRRKPVCRFWKESKSYFFSFYIYIWFSITQISITRTVYNYMEINRSNSNQPRDKRAVWKDQNKCSRTPWSIDSDDIFAVKMMRMNFVSFVVLYQRCCYRWLVPHPLQRPLRWRELQLLSLEKKKK